MTARFSATPFAGSLAARVAARHGAAGGADPGFTFYWLGQAGFLLHAAGAWVLIDPYLSDSLAEKYRDGPFSHERMMPPPIGLDELPPIALVACTHAHTDHMDPATLAPLARMQPGLRILAPQARRQEALQRAAIGPERLLTLDAGARLAPVPGLTIAATRSAHETLLTEGGAHVFLGYAMGCDDVTLWHSGDTIAFDGQDAEVAALRPDLALLPVNGRSDALTSRGVPGNLTLAEAETLARRAGIPTLLAHHHGMFAFNTLPVAQIETAGRNALPSLTLLPARPGMEYRLHP